MTVKSNLTTDTMKSPKSSTNAVDDRLEHNNVVERNAYIEENAPKRANHRSSFSEDIKIVKNNQKTIQKSIEPDPITGITGTPHTGKNQSALLRGPNDLRMEHVAISPPAEGGNEKIK